MSDPILVVGGGISGLAVAAERSARGDAVRLIERLPAVGGVLGYRDGLVVQLRRECERNGVDILAGVTAVRWVDNRLLVIGPDGIEWLPGSQLVVAGGSRPSHLAELSVVGSRLAGVVPATVALHLAEAGIVLGRRPIVYGAGHWADAVLPLLRESADSIVRVLPPGSDRGSRVVGAEVFDGYELRAVLGMGRVSEAQIARGTESQFVACDAVVLAHRVTPLRNIDGANQPAPGVSFAQHAGDAVSKQDVVEAARAMARELVVSNGRAQ